MRAVEARVHVEQQGCAGSRRLQTRRIRIAVDNVPGCITRPQVEHIFPRQVIASRCDQVSPQFVERGKRGLRDFTPGVGPFDAGVTVEHVHAGLPVAGSRILHPFPEQGRKLTVGAVSLALVDIGRGMVDPERRAVLCETAHVGPRDHDPGRRAAAGRIDDAVHRVIRREIDGDLRAVGTLTHEIEAVVEKLAKENEPAVHGRNARVGGADEPLVVGAAIRVDGGLVVLLTERLQHAVVGDRRVAVGVLHKVRATRLRHEGNVGRGDRATDHPGSIVRDIGLGEVGLSLGVVGRSGILRR